MRVPFGWLREFVKIDVTPEELCDTLIMLGFADATVVPNEWGMLDSFVVGRASKIAPHPTDPHLKVVTVNVGYADLASVCGAPVIDEGNLYAVALPGATMGTGRHVDSAEVAGVLSQCVLTSGKEAWIDESRDELLRVDEEVAPGTALVEALGLTDPVIEMEVTPNRGDCLGLIGIARELAAVFGKELLIPQPDLREDGAAVQELVSVEVEDREGCPRYGAMVCEGVEIKGSPARVRAKLRLAGVRPINNVVDATNTVLLETGHPLHAFDLDTLAGPKVVVRRAADGEKFAALDGNEYKLSKEDLVIADTRKAIAVAGVIGGSETEVSASTKRVLIEGAFFDHCSVWKTARRLELATEASYRFERGVDVGAVLYVLARTCSLVQQGTRCRVARGVVDVYPNPVKPRRFTVSPKRVNKLLGTSIPEQEICDYLERLGFLVSPGRELDVIVPTRRNDVESEADVAEEVARLYGYDRIGEKTTLTCQIYARLPHEFRRTRELKQVLRSIGLYEIVTDSMVGPSNLEIYGDSFAAPIRILNPIGVETSFLRSSLVPGVVGALVSNEFKGQEGVALFEMGKVYLRAGLDPVEPYRLVIGLSGLRRPRAWHSVTADWDLYDLKGIVEMLGDLVGVRIESREIEHPALHPGRRMGMALAGEGGERNLGWVGELAPSICEGLGSKRRLYVADIDPMPLVESAEKMPRYKEVPKYPAVKRDLAVVVPESVREGEVSRMILEEGGPLVSELDVFDVYRGKQIPEGTKSLAYAIAFRSDSRTLKEEEIDDVQRKIEQRLGAQFGARIRDR